MDPILTALFTQGGLGLIAGLLLWLYVKTQDQIAKLQDRIAELNGEVRDATSAHLKQLSEEQHARVDDAKQFTETALALQGQIHDAIERLEAIASRGRR